MITAAAVRALAEDRLSPPPRICTVRPESACEMDLPGSGECGAVNDPSLPEGMRVICERPPGHPGVHCRLVPVTWESCKVCNDRPYKGMQCMTCGRRG